MIKKTIRFNDLDGNPVTRTYYFNLDRLEALKLEIDGNQGLSKVMEAVVEAEDTAGVFRIMEQLIELSYGVKSEDNLGFDKDPIHLKQFKNTKAYPSLIFGLIGNPGEAIDFFNGLVDDAEIEELHQTTASIQKYILDNPDQVPADVYERFAKDAAENPIDATQAPAPEKFEKGGVPTQVTRDEAPYTKQQLEAMDAETFADRVLSKKESEMTRFELLEAFKRRGRGE